MQEASKASSRKKADDPSTLSRRDREKLEMQQQQEESEDIKEICDVSSGMASSVMQVYLKQVKLSSRAESPIYRDSSWT